MNKIVWKYELRVVDEQFVEMPEHAQILCVQTQKNRPCLWALVDPDARRVSRKFWTYGTGNPFDDVLQTYIGTYQLEGGSLVFHLFEEGKPWNLTNTRAA